MRNPPSSPSTRPLAQRRSGSTRRRKYASLTIRLSPEERAQIAADAARAGLSLGGYVRVRLCAAPSPIRAVRHPPVNAEILARVLAQLGRVGGNLHQLVRHLNFGDYAAVMDAPAVLAELRQVSAAIMGALGQPPRHDH